MKSSTFRKSIIAAMGATVMLATAQAAAQAAEPTLAGVWRVTRHGVSCLTGQQVNSFPALMTFHKDGTMHNDSVGPGSTAAEGTAEHGVWQREPGDHNYSFSILGYGWDPQTGAFEGSAEIRGTLQLTTSNSFAYDARIQFIDPAGNVLVTLCGSATGARFE